MTPPGREGERGGREGEDNGWEGKVPFDTVTSQ